SRVFNSVVHLSALPNCSVCPYTTLFRSFHCDLQPHGRRPTSRCAGPLRDRGIVAGSAALPDHCRRARELLARRAPRTRSTPRSRSEEHTSELQSREKLVCRLLLEKKYQY